MREDGERGCARDETRSARLGFHFTWTGACDSITVSPSATLKTSCPRSPSPSQPRHPIAPLIPRTPIYISTHHVQVLQDRHARPRGGRREDAEVHPGPPGHWRASPSPPRPPRPALTPTAQYDPLVQPQLLRHEIKLSPESQKTIASARYAAARILAGQDDRVLVIVGPCSIHSPSQAIEYATLLKSKIPEWSNLHIIMRAYLCVLLSFLRPGVRLCVMARSSRDFQRAWAVGPWICGILQHPSRESPGCA